MTKSLIALAFLSVAATASEPAQKIDISKLPQQTQVVDDVVVPVPSEIFNVLDKLGKPNWAGVLRAPKGTVAPFGNPSQIALNLGTIIAEGFVAVEAGNVAAVKDIGKSVLSLSKALGVSKEVTSRANAIIAAADTQDWQLVRKELDGALGQVRGAMTELGSAQLADLVSLGGWLRGTEALCEVVEKNYSKDGADLLRQEMLLSFFANKLKGMATKKPEIPLVPKIQDGLKSIQQIIGLAADADISAKSVKEIGGVASGLVKAIQTK
jgi:hypothetical protein